MKMQAMEIYQLACSFHQQLNLSKQELQNILMDYIPHLYIPLIMDMEEAKGLELYLQQNSSVNIIAFFLYVYENFRHFPMHIF